MPNQKKSAQKTIAIVGLGRMGANMARRLLQHKFTVVGYNRSSDKTKALQRYGLTATYDLDTLIDALPKKKIIWLMLPAGKPTDEYIDKLLPLLNEGDIIINGANAFYKEVQRQNIRCAKKGVHLFDVGVSGGIWGLQNGFTLMAGGPKNQFKHIEPFCKALAPKKGYAYFGPIGSGHFVKSVHNIVEYTYLQGLAEGVELLSKFEHPIDISRATETWQPASVVRSWLLELTTKALRRPDFKKISPKIASVTIEELQKTKQAVKGTTPGFDQAVKIRKDTSAKFKLGKQVIAAVRREFGGHAVTKK